MESMSIQCHYIGMSSSLSRAKSRSKYIGFQLTITCHKVEYPVMLHSLVVDGDGDAYSDAYGDADSDTSGDVDGDPNDT
jgi:hypothetical protein